MVAWCDKSYLIWDSQIEQIHHITLKAWDIATVWRAIVNFFFDHKKHFYTIEALTKGV